MLAGLSGLAHGVSIIIDDSDPGFTDHNIGTMLPATPGGLSTLYNNSAQTSLIVLQNAPDSYVSWTFTGLDPTKVYDVAATWNPINFWAPNNLGTDANYTIIGDSTIMHTLIQSTMPTADYVEDDSFSAPHDFQTIGQMQPKSDGTIVLELRDQDANGILGVVADAALVSVVPEPSAAILLGLGGLTMVFRRKKQ